MAKQRLDLILVERGLFPSRERAQAAVMAGLVRVAGTPVTKPGQGVAADAAIEVIGQAHPYVSRGGLKLERALSAFGVSAAGRVALDAGASTGGFTDVLLRAGALKVYAVDVGYGQLAWSLRQDPRVVVRERTNVRHVTPGDFDEPIDLIVADLSFISLGKVLGALSAVLAPAGEALMLIKPQFEAGREQVGKGVVRDPAVHRSVIAGVRSEAAAHGWALVGLTHSPIKGPEGNREFLAYFRPGAEPSVSDAAIEAAVRAAHEELDA